jgi:uncharacterized membrane protein
MAALLLALSENDYAAIGILGGLLGIGLIVTIPIALVVFFVRFVIRLSTSKDAASKAMTRSDEKKS